MNNNYESMRTLFVTALFVCTCAVAQAQTQVNESPTARSSVHQSILEVTPLDARRSTQIAAAGVAQNALLVQRLESDFGPFDARLSEPLLAAGNMLAEGGDFHAAIRAMERALYVMRVNQGLYSEPQIAVVERLIEFNAALQDWEAVDENFHYLEFLYTRLFDLGGLKWDHGIAKVADWHVIAINNNLGGKREEHLREANKLFRLRLLYAEQDQSVDKRVIDVLRHNVEYTAYHLQNREMGIRTEPIYSRLDSHDRDDRAGSLASVD